MQPISYIKKEGEHTTAWNHAPEKTQTCKFEHSQLMQHMGEPVSEHEREALHRNGTHRGKLSLCIACNKARTAGRGSHTTVQATVTNIENQIQLKIASRWKQMGLDRHK